MENTLQEIIVQATELKPEYGEYKNHAADPFTHGINVLTTTDYTLVGSKELISDFEKGVIDNKTIVSKLKIKREPTK
jgi:hypothetical protein